MKRWSWVEHIVVGKQGQNRKAWANLKITLQPVCFLRCQKIRLAATEKRLMWQLVAFVCPEV